MASDLDFVEYVRDQMLDAGSISFRKMFGEYAIYCNGKVISLVCDNRLFVKPTAGARAMIGRVVEAPPYPGAKPYFLIEEGLDDREWVSSLVRLTERETPRDPVADAQEKSRHEKAMSGRRLFGSAAS